MASSCWCNYIMVRWWYMPTTSSWCTKIWYKWYWWQWKWGHRCHYQSKKKYNHDNYQTCVVLYNNNNNNIIIHNIKSGCAVGGETRLPKALHFGDFLEFERSRQNWLKTCKTKKLYESKLVISAYLWPQRRWPILRTGPDSTNSIALNTSNKPCSY